MLIISGPFCPSLTRFMVSVNVKHHAYYKRSLLSVPNSPYGLCGRKALTSEDVIQRSPQSPGDPDRPSQPSGISGR